ncbi:unnamed protein product [Prorocentrum cordatum]|uniref:Subtilisin n=1 Tax=Prorocentrum cordatum TaxID=2364126 RepID=A0ABN9XNE3_9DINO|nr:unnamed protein product [Polarella glacialis]
MPCTFGMPALLLFCLLPPIAHVRTAKSEHADDATSVPFSLADVPHVGECGNVLESLDPHSDLNMCKGVDGECPSECKAALQNAKSCVGKPVQVGSESRKFDITIFLPLLTQSYSSRGADRSHTLWNCIRDSGGLELEDLFLPSNGARADCDDAVEAFRLSRLSACDSDENRIGCGRLCSRILGAVRSRCNSTATFRDRDGNEKSIADPFVQSYLLDVTPRQCQCALRRGLFGESRACTEPELDNDAGLAVYASAGYPRYRNRPARRSSKVGLIGVSGYPWSQSTSGVPTSRIGTVLMCFVINPALLLPAFAHSCRPTCTCRAPCPHAEGFGFVLRVGAASYRARVSWWRTWPCCCSQASSHAALCGLCASCTCRPASSGDSWASP